MNFLVVMLVTMLDPIGALAALVLGLTIRNVWVAALAAAAARLAIQLAVVGTNTSALVLVAGALGAALTAAIACLLRRALQKRQPTP